MSDQAKQQPTDAVEKALRAHDGAGVPYQPKVTCKACLRLAARWMRNDEST